MSTSFIIPALVLYILGILISISVIVLAFIGSMFLLNVGEDWRF